MYPQTIKLRVDAKDVELWKKGARYAGLTLSEWVRRKCNGEEITTKPWTPKEKVRAVKEAEKVPTARSTRKCSHGVTEGFQCWVCGDLAKVKE